MEPLRARTLDDFLRPPAEYPLFPTLSDNPLDNQSETPSSEESDSSMPFETALQRLHATLTGALDFFTHLDASFDEETRPIAGYARAAVLDQVWTAKVSSARDVHEERKKKNETWMMKCRRVVSYFTKKRTPRLRSNSDDTSIANNKNNNPYHNVGKKKNKLQTFPDYMARIEKDLVEAICARWPPGIKKGLDPEMMSNVALIGLNFLYDRMTALVNRLQEGSANEEMRMRHVSFRAFVRDVELLVISMEQSGEYWRVEV